MTLPHTEPNTTPHSPAGAIGSSREARPTIRTNFAIGDSIGGEYRVEQVMRGGMGAVYVVKHHEQEEPIVLKTVLGTENEAAKSYFQREAELWIGLGAHPNIVRALWARAMHGCLYVAAEYVSPDDIGRNSIADHIRYGRVHDRVIAKWIVQFCHGMMHATRNGILVHRDVKPANLMVDEYGDLLISDFGLAKPLEPTDFALIQPNSSPNEFTSGTLGGSGTPAYMSPEQILGDDTLDSRADIYSFGVTLYEICVRARPFVARTSREILQMQLDVEPELPESIFKGIISKCLAKRRDQRYRNFDELLAHAQAVGSTLGITLPKLPKSIDSKVEALYAQALSHSTFGRPREAMTCIDAYIAKRPDDYRGWTQKGRLFLETGQLALAVESTKKSLALNPANSHAWNNLGVLCMRQSDTQSAIEAYQEALTIDPLNTGAMLNLASPLTEQKKFQEARELLSRALKLQPQKASIWHNMGNIFKFLEDPAEAKKCYLKALELDPTISQSRIALRALEEGDILFDAAALLQAGRIAEAQTILEATVTSHPEDAVAWHNLGLACVHSRDLLRAKNCFSKSLEFKPDDTFALKQLVQLNAETNNLEAALEYCDRLSEIPNEKISALLLKAQLMHIAGRGVQAIKLLLAASERYPQRDEILFVLGDLLVKAGSRKEALTIFRKCERLIERNPKAIDNLRLIRENIELLKSEH